MICSIIVSINSCFFEGVRSPPNTMLDFTTSQIVFRASREKSSNKDCLTDLGNPLRRSSKLKTNSVQDRRKNVGDREGKRGKALGEMTRMKQDLTRP